MEPACDDLSLYVIGGRVKSAAAALDEAEAAERVGLGRLWLSERYDLKEAGTLLGGMAARTSRLRLGTAALFPGSRPPILTAALGATMHSAFGPRFTLGLGRSMGAYIRNANMRAISFQELQDYADIFRRLWRGETVDYDGPIGTFTQLHMADTYDGPAPQIYSVMLGGPKACKVAASPLFDGVYLQPFMTVEAVAQSVAWIREEAERIGRDPATMTICAPMISAPELPDEQARAYMHARMVTYIGQPGMPENYERLNGWEIARMDPVRQHPMFAQDPERIDHNFHRSQLLEVANLVPDEWMYATSLTGSLESCVAKMQQYKDAGADEISFYGSTVAENAALVGAWRAAKGVPA
ncbi:MAG: family class F420-dependent oxidoreductase [Solirubrobacterales bacterium]|nr:family class F420-dependent oxidoreductase [Solirubrobacterales bacterium]